MCKRCRSFFLSINSEDFDRRRKEEEAFTKREEENFSSEVFPWSSSFDGDDDDDRDSDDDSDAMMSRFSSTPSSPRFPCVSRTPNPPPLSFLSTLSGTSINFASRASCPLSLSNPRSSTRLIRCESVLSSSSTRRRRMCGVLRTVFAAGRRPISSRKSRRRFSSV